MGELLNRWLPQIIAAVFLLAAVYLISPPGRMRAAVRFAGGLVLLTVLLSPLTGLEWTGVPSYTDWESDVDGRIREMRSAYAETTRTLIEEKTAAYISDKGRDLGVTCRPTVTAQLRDGVAYPFSAVMDCPFHPALSAYLTQELDIPPERQSWQGR